MNTTPGPWHVERQMNGFAICQADGSRDGIRIAYTAAHGHGETEQANANLIAAAPELLEALRTATMKLEDVREWCLAYADTKQARSVQVIAEDARAALAKAQADKHIIAKFDKPSRDDILKAGEQAGL